MDELRIAKWSLLCANVFLAAMVVSCLFSLKIVDVGPDCKVALPSFSFVFWAITLVISFIAVIVCGNISKRSEPMMGWFFGLLLFLPLGFFCVLVAEKLHSAAGFGWKLSYGLNLVGPCIFFVVSIAMLAQKKRDDAAVKELVQRIRAQSVEALKTEFLKLEENNWSDVNRFHDLDEVVKIATEHAGSFSKGAFEYDIVSQKIGDSHREWGKRIRRHAGNKFSISEYQFSSGSLNDDYDYDRYI